MTLNSSGPISLGGNTAGQSINLELGVSPTAQISFNDWNVRLTANLKSNSTAISVPTNFYGKGYFFQYTISANTSQLCLRAGAIAAGWNECQPLRANINPSRVVYSTTTTIPALTITGSFPKGVTLYNNGIIVGMGGAGNGNAGGTAIKANTRVTIYNLNTISGGGGGGGQGAYAQCSCGFVVNGGGGGGGRSGLTNSAGGAAGGSGGQTAGGCGTYSGAGGGGTFGTSGCAQSGVGGSGGGWGAIGGTGGCAGSGAVVGSPASGGTGGKATCGAASFITWVVLGTRNGTVG